MSDPNYPDDIRQYDSDPKSPFYVDPTESVKFEDNCLEITKARISDSGGYLLESFSEAPEKWLSVLSDLVIEWVEAPSDKEADITRVIGAMVAVQISGYCTPTDDEVLEALGGDETGDLW